MNYLAVAISALAAFLIGWAWYSPFLFANVWMKEIGMNPDDMRPDMTKMMPTMLVALIQQLVTAYILAHFAVAYGATDTTAAVQLGIWVWLGFMATTFLGPVLWEKRSLTWYAIVASQLLVSTIVMSLIVVLWH